VLTWTRRNLDGNPANPAVTSPGVVAVAPQRSDGSGVSNGPTAYENDEWVVNTKFPSLEPLPGIDVELLPVGVGVQLITGESLVSADDELSAQGPDGFIERYVRTGLIAFDARGTLLTSADYNVAPGGRVGTIVGLPLIAGSINGGIPLNAANGRTSFGLVVYSEDAFDDAPSDGTAIHWRAGGVNTDFVQTSIDAVVIEDSGSDIFATSDGDVTRAYPFGDAPGSFYAEYAEERWLDANTTPLLVNRFSGTLAEASSE